MPRAARSEISQLVQEVRGLEVLASEAEIEPSRLQDYWAVSADLITLVMDVETYESEASRASEGDSALLALRHRARDIGARLAQLTQE
ncbi:MAG TPA: hypothetical protein VF221_06140 [Chloroflexota bacterium]